MSQAKVGKARIRIRMERSFEEFGAAQREAFLHGFAGVAGVLVSEIENVSFRNGCVIFEGELDAKAIEALVDLFER